MGGDKRWTYGQVFQVVREFLFVDTGWFVPRLIYMVHWYSQSVPSMPSVWRLDFGASFSEE